MAQTTRVAVLYPYVATDSSQLNLRPNDVLTVYEAYNDDWMYGYNENTGDEGYFPGTYVEYVDDYQPKPGRYADRQRLRGAETYGGGGGAEESEYSQNAEYYDPETYVQPTGRGGGGGGGRRQDQRYHHTESNAGDQEMARNSRKPTADDASVSGRPLLEEDDRASTQSGNRRTGRTRKVKPVVDEKKDEAKATAKFKGPREDKPECNTRYGMYGVNMVRLNAFGLFAVGVASLGTWVKGVFIDQMADAAAIFTLPTVIVFAYATLAGFLIFLIEIHIGKDWPKGNFSYRALFYTLAAGPLFENFFTATNGALFLIAAFFCYLGVRYDEEVPPAREPAGEKGKHHEDGGCSCCCVCNYYENKVRDGKCGKEVFMYLYIAANLGLMAVGLIQFYPMVAPGGMFAQFTTLLPWAKGFGFALDFTASVILFPVCRVFIRRLYDSSTQDQSSRARCLRAVLWLFPLDKALHFHEKTGWLILFLSFGHSIAHLVNAGVRFQAVILFYGWSPLITGVLLWIVIFFMFPAVLRNVKGGHFEIFWYSHQLFWAFFLLNLIHGRFSIGPHYYMAFALPGAIYLAERVYRAYSAYQTVSIISITNMKDSVISIEFSKSAFPMGYLEGQYCYINCPSISPGQWHPFTISSAPDAENVTLHIKVLGKNAWTRKLLEYFSTMGRPGASYFELADAGPNGVQVGKTVGPQGERMLLVYGPHSAPTQHVPEYSVAMIVGSGIGVTPVSSTMQEIVYYRWRFNVGLTNPDHAYFVWVCSYNEINTFRWMIRIIKEAHDRVWDMRDKQPDSMANKTFEVHIWITSAPEDLKEPEPVVVDDDIGFWGQPRRPEMGVAKSPEIHSEVEIYSTMLYPPKGEPAELGDIRIYNGRPKWDEHFRTVAGRHPAVDVGVAFCGNPRIADDLRDSCRKYTNPAQNQGFKLHKENF